jgi:hypothetical protein
MQQDQFILFNSKLKYIPTSFTDPRARITEEKHYLISSAISPEILKNYELINFSRDKFYLAPAEKSSPSFTIGAYKAYNFSKKILALRDENIDSPVAVNGNQDYNGLFVTFLKGDYNIKLNFEAPKVPDGSRIKLSASEFDAFGNYFAELSRYYLEKKELENNSFDFNLKLNKNVPYFELTLESDGDAEIKISSIEISLKM